MLDIESFAVKNVSYLQARDPSILAWNKHGLDRVRVNLAKKLEEDISHKSNENQETEDNNIQVFLRIKNGVPFQHLYVIDGDNLICKVPDGSHALRNIKDGEKMTKTYSFSRIFGPETKQIELFDSIIKAKMLGFINGKNCTLLTYGASGSGKTFTIVGTPEEPGLIPRALEYIFRTIPQLKETPKAVPLPNGEVKCMDEELYQTEKLHKSAILNATVIDRLNHIKTYTQMQQRLSSERVAEIDDFTKVSVSIWVSFAEIYNENIYDLLQMSPQRGKQRPRLRLGKSKDCCYIKDLTTIHASSGIEAYQILQFGLHNLNYAATSINPHSSRSHCIFTMRLIQTCDGEEGAYVSTFNFCDLAGSERVKKTMNVGDRLKESNNINTSLLVLGRCISNIRSTQQLKDNRLIPFRESKLTQLFQRALMGLEDIMMMVNINPSRDMFDESQHVLNFSAVAKEILVEEQPKIVKPKKKNRFSEYMDRKTTSVRPKEDAGEEDEKDMEIERLKVIISNLYTEIENKTREFKVELKLERDHMSSCYNEYIEKLTKERAAIINKMKKEYNEIKDLNDYYLKIINDRGNVITIDDSSSNSSQDEGEDTSPRKKSSRKKIEELQIIISEKNDRISAHQQELCEMKIEKERLEKELQVVPKLKDQVKNLTEEETSLKIMLKDAEEVVMDLQKELQEETLKNKKLISQNLQLKEKLDYLEEQLFSYTSTSNS